MKKTVFILSTIILLLSINNQAFAQKNIELLGKVAYPQGLSNLWGWTSPAGNEYAVVGTRTGTAIVDISNPSAPVEKFFVPDITTTWREVKVWSHYAYVVTDSQQGNGLLIIDLNNLDANLPLDYVFHNFGIGLVSSHTNFADENGILYLFGSNEVTINNVDVVNGGAIMLDLKQDPMNPAVIGYYDKRYIHDGFVRGDTLWAAEIYDGFLEVLNVSNKMNPIALGEVETPNSFTHNCWLSDNGKTIFTTDEVYDAYITSYDVSDVTDIKELCRTQSQNADGVKKLPSPHNTYVVKKDFITTSYYTDGVTIHDVSQPDNMVLVGWYDCSDLDGAEFNGDWGVYPYFPSGNIILSDMQQGLFILKPKYAKACFLTGTITDENTNSPISEATISVLNSNINNIPSDFNGKYKTGTADAGIYTIKIQKFGYEDKIIENITLENGNTTTVNANLTPKTAFTINALILDANGTPIANTDVIFKGNLGGEYTATTDQNGNLNIAQFYDGSYLIYIGKWGIGIATNFQINNQNNIVIVMPKGYYDDFNFNNNWTVNSNDTIGNWDYGKPIGAEIFGTAIHPYNDLDNDFGDKCWSTGNSGNNFDFVVNNTTNLTTPNMDLSNFEQPVVRFYAWFINVNQNNWGDDSLIVTINNGFQSTDLLVLTNKFDDSFKKYTIDLNGIIPLTNTTTISFKAKANNTGNQILECALDGFYLYDKADLNTSTPTVNLPNFNNVSIIPNPFTNKCTIKFNNFDLWGKQSPFVFTLFDTMGRTILQTNLNQNTITIQNKNLNKGMYYFTVNNLLGNRLAQGKIVAD